MTRREQLEAAIERAVAMLDRLDGDPDLERDDDLEPGGDDELEWQWPVWNRAAV